MTTEENKRMLALSYIVADLKAENIELAQRVQQLVDDYNDVVRQLNGKETHKDEDPAKLLLGNMQKMRDNCDKLEGEYNKLKFLAKGIHSFVKEKNLYIKKEDECPYCRRGITACSPYCMACGSCLGDIYGYGVICEKRLSESNVSFPDND